MSDAQADQAELELDTEQVDSEASETTDQSVEDGQQVEPEPEPTYDYLEVEDPSVKYVKVTVDGEEVSVPLAEALQGYSRQADYTRKTQSLAEEREQLRYAQSLAQALQAAPGLTVQALAQQAGMSVEDYLGLSPRQQEQARKDNTDTDEYADPLERALAEERDARLRLEQRIEQQEADRILSQSIDGLKRQYSIGDDEAREVVGVALQNGYGPESFSMIYQSMAFQKLQAKAQAQREADEAKNQQRQQRQAAAAASTQRIGSGTGATGVTGTPASDGNMSMREAIEAAFEQFEGA